MAKFKASDYIIRAKDKEKATAQGKTSRDIIREREQAKRAASSKQTSQPTVLATPRAANVLADAYMAGDSKAISIVEKGVKVAAPGEEISPGVTLKPEPVREVFMTPAVAKAIADASPEEQARVLKSTDSYTVISPGSQVSASARLSAKKSEVFLSPSVGKAISQASLTEQQRLLSPNQSYSVVSPGTPVSASAKLSNGIIPQKQPAVKPTGILAQQTAVFTAKGKQTESSLSKPNNAIASAATVPPVASLERWSAAKEDATNFWNKTLRYNPAVQFVMAGVKPIGEGLPWLKTKASEFASSGKGAAFIAAQNPVTKLGFKASSVGADIAGGAYAEVKEKPGEFAFNLAVGTLIGGAAKSAGAVISRGDKAYKATTFSKTILGRSVRASAIGIGKGASLSAEGLYLGSVGVRAAQDSAKTNESYGKSLGRIAGKEVVPLYAGAYYGSKTFKREPVNENRNYFADVEVKQSVSKTKPIENIQVVRSNKVEIINQKGEYFSIERISPKKKMVFEVVQPKNDAPLLIGWQGNKPAAAKPKKFGLFSNKKASVYITKTVPKRGIKKGITPFGTPVRRVTGLRPSVTRSASSSIGISPFGLTSAIAATTYGSKSLISSNKDKSVFQGISEKSEQQTRQRTSRTFISALGSSLSVRKLQTKSSAYDFSSAQRQTSSYDQSIFQKQKVTPDQGQKQSQSTTQTTKEISVPVPIIIPNIIPKPPTPRRREKPRGPEIGWPGDDIGAGGPFSFGKPGSKRSRKILQYTPSLTAIGLNIRGAKPKGPYFGLSLRPIISKKKK